MSQFINLAIFKRNRPYFLLYAGSFISFLGTSISFVALPYQIYQLTQSSLMVGLLSLTELLPLLITALLGGVFADRHSRRRLLLGSEVILALGALCLLGNSLLASPSISLIFIIGTVMSAITGLHRPAFEGLIQQLLAGEDYKTVAALQAFAHSFGMICGPALGGMLIASFGVSLAYAIDFASFIASIALLLAVGKMPNPPAAAHSPILQSLKEGIQFAYTRPVLLGSYLVDFCAMVFAIPNALFPAMAALHFGVQSLGLLYAAPSVGSLVISLFSGWTSNVQHEGRAIALAAMAWGLAMLGFGLAPNLGLALSCLALAGAADAISGIFRVSLWNRSIPSQLRGRLAGIEMLSYLSGPKLGDARVGFAAKYFGLAPAIVSGGALCILSVGFCCFKLKAFWNYKIGDKNDSQQ